MAYRLICTLAGKTTKATLEPGRNLIGSGDDCAVCLPHPTVSRRHASIHLEGGVVTLEDTGSSNGTLVNSRRIEGPLVIALDAPFFLGSVEARVEAVRAGDLSAALSIGNNTEPPTIDPPRAPRPAARTTLSDRALETFTLEHMPRILSRWQQGAPAIEVIQTLGGAVFRSFPCAHLEISRRVGGNTMNLFQAATPSRPQHFAEVVETCGDIEVRITFYPASAAEIYAPIAGLTGRWSSLAHSWRRRTSTPPAHEALTPPPLPSPPSVDARVRDLYARAARIAVGDIGILIQGESGTGKEILARYCHAASGRPADRFVALNCAALPRDLLELELFGIESAVATGVDARPGKFELADGGTLFLDEIGDMAVETQAKILRVLQEGEVYRLGAKTPRSAIVRVLSATHRDIETRVRAGAFRGDLYHRIAGWVVSLPPLRQRAADIPNLVAHFLTAEGERLNLHPAGVSESALKALLAFPWPGNIRQLQTTIAQAALFLEDGELLESSHLPPSIANELRTETTLKERLERVEREEIERALALCGGSVAQAAEQLGVGRSTLYRRMNELDVEERTTG